MSRRLASERMLPRAPGESCGGADEAGGGGERAGGRLAGNDEPLAEREVAGVAARERNPTRHRRVGQRLGQSGGIDDLALDPGAVALAGERLDQQAQQAIAVVRVLKPS